MLQDQPDMMQKPVDYITFCWFWALNSVIIQLYKNVCLGCKSLVLLDFVVLHFSCVRGFQEGNMPFIPV